MTSIYNWALSAADNANADPFINWSEGQPPSTVNNSARAMMQRMREFVADLGGDMMASGSANAITLSANMSLSGYSHGIMLRFRALATNTGSVSINVNFLGSKPLVTTSSRGLVALTGGEMQKDGLYEIIYYGALYGNTGGWFLTNPTPAQSVPVGAISAFAMAMPPVGWIKCNGIALSRTSYAALYSTIGTSWGAGDGVTSFNVPDLRGQFLRGADEGRGQDPGRLFASSQGDQNKAHNHGGTTNINGAHSHHYMDHDTVAGEFVYEGTRSFGHNIFSMPRQTQRTTQAVTAHSHVIEADGGLEARPKNIAVIYAIKA